MLINKIIDSYKRESYNLNDSIVFVNFFSYLKIRSNDALYKNANLVYIDGILLVIFLRLFVKTNIIRYSFDNTSLADDVFLKLNDESKSLCVIGSEKKHLDNFIDYMNVNYPNINVVYHRNGYFSNDSEIEECQSEIIMSNPDAVVVGMGSPHQELFMNKLTQRKYDGFLVSCGGFIHQTSDSGKLYYPQFINNNNLRWAYRIYKEPKLLERYFLKYPVSILYFLFDMFIYKISECKVK